MPYKICRVYRYEFFHKNVSFTTLVILYTQQVYVSQPLWYCIVLCRLVFHNPFGYVSQPLWYCVKS